LYKEGWSRVLFARNDLLTLLCNTVTYTVLDGLLWIVVINLIFSRVGFFHQRRDTGSMVGYGLKGRNGIIPLI
jgi:hypothetical protein